MPRAPRRSLGDKIEDLIYEIRECIEERYERRSAGRKKTEKSRSSNTKFSNAAKKISQEWAAKKAQNPGIKYTKADYQDFVSDWWYQEERRKAS